MKMINVTRTSLPPLEQYIRYLRDIWSTRWLTNNGKYVQLLEKELKEYLHVKNILPVSNGTLALQLAIKAFKLKGEVITTPFTFAATTNVLLWEGLRPVFADVDSNTFNIDPDDVEKKISSKTTAILAVHVYGNPCNVIRLEQIARKYKLKLIYDAAHAFGVEYRSKSILTYGHASTLSFHATKTFHTIEGGAIVTQNNTLYNVLRLYINFGIKNEEEVILPGINAKMNEFQAAMGLANIPSVDANAQKRKIIYETYTEQLKNCKTIRFQELHASKYNYSYMPILLKNRILREYIHDKLLENNVKTRKYFYPLTSDFVYTKTYANSKQLKRARTLSESVLCLPIYSDLKFDDVLKIVKIIKNSC
jgi:dTDP-4-amino-4,6-dideoxygalactose transaminase